MFAKLRYPERLINITISKFLNSVFQPELSKPDVTVNKTIPIVIPFKDQKSATAVRKQLKDLSVKVGSVELLPVFTSPKIENQLKHRET